VDNASEATGYLISMLPVAAIGNWFGGEHELTEVDL
jgi:hypothetical protein